MLDAIKDHQAASIKVSTVEILDSIPKETTYPKRSEPGGGNIRAKTALKRSIETARNRKN